MPKKAKNAPTRKDKFYKKAKEQGYRARSAFKLAHLNNLHGFLRTAKVCVDLCAAPGSWMQIAREFMPSGSVIIGVDLNPIKPIPGTISIRGDITTDSLRSELRNTLKCYKADVVLHDGAPNVGTNWAQDAYDQNVLVLHAFKLACEFLRFGGDFITKVFRSKDSASLEFVFKCLFKKVECTKPQASRFESAEIFYVCRHYKLRPEDKADPKFFDPKEVFKEVSETKAPKVNLNKPEKINKKAEGYEEGIEILYKPTSVTEFVETDSFEALLQQSSELLFDDNRWSDHPSTTDEVRECCKDIKLLGRKELRLLLLWRKALRAELDAERLVLEIEEKRERERQQHEAEKIEEQRAEAEEEEEMKMLQEQINQLDEFNLKEDKKKQRAIQKQKRHLQQRLKLMSLAGEASETRDDELFNIVQMEKVRDEDAVVDQYDKINEREKNATKPPKYLRYKKGDFELDEDGVTYRPVGDVSDSSTDESDGEETITKAALAAKKKLKAICKDGIEFVKSDSTSSNLRKKKSVRFADPAEDSDSSDYDTTDEEDNVNAKPKSECEHEVQEEKTDENEVEMRALDKEVEEEEDSGVDHEEDDDMIVPHLTTDLVGDVPNEKRERVMETWFTQHPDLGGLDSDDEDDFDIEMNGAIESYKRSGGAVIGEEEDEGETAEENESDIKEPTDSSSAKLPTTKKVTRSMAATANEEPATDERAAGSGDGNPVLTEKKRLPDLDAVGLALATKMVQTKKARRDFELQGWNRYMTSGQEDLPSWFLQDEEIHMAPYLEPDEELVRHYTARDKAVNARTLRKVMEAKARKKRRFKKAMQKIVKKTEAMQGSAAMTNVEKQEEIKNMYKKVLLTRKKKETKYVVMKKKDKGKKPRGVTGRYKLVDARLKKDVRAKMKAIKKKKTVGRGKPKNKK